MTFRGFGIKKWRGFPGEAKRGKNIFAFSKIIFIFDPTNQIFLPLNGCLVFIKKGEEIRL